MLAPDVIDRAERRVGETLRDRWRLDRVIGVGGMAAVYEATHRNRNRVAIKLLHPVLSLDESTRQRFLREGYVANTIGHPGAVQVLDDDVTDDGVAFLVMELLTGETLEERLMDQEGVLPLATVLDITNRLLDVLVAAHAESVVHRDIKPDNIFLTTDGRLKVLDFGIARLHQGDRGSTRHGSFMGTPAFCAPEQARGRWNEVDARTDVFSVGATMFTALTGEHLHQAETSSEQLALAIGTQARSLAEVWPEAPREVALLVDRALSYDKEHRFQSATEMQQAVQGARERLPEAGSAPLQLSASSAPAMARSVSGALSHRPSRRAETVPQTIARLSRGRPQRIGLLVGVLLAASLAWVLVVFSERAETPSASGQSASPANGRNEAQAAEEEAPASPSPKTREDSRAPETGSDAEATEEPDTASDTAKTAPQGASKKSADKSSDSGESKRPSSATSPETPPSKSFRASDPQEPQGEPPATARTTAPAPAPAPRPSPSLDDSDDIFEKRY